MATTINLPVMGVLDRDTGQLTGIAVGQTPVASLVTQDASGNLVGADGSTIYSPPKTVVASSTVTMNKGDNSINSVAGGATTLQLGVPTTGSGTFRVENADDLSNTAVYLKHFQKSLRLGNSGSSVTLPSVTMPATTDAGLTVGVLIRTHAVNTASGTTHYAFLKIGSGSAYFLLAYEGLNATNPGCLKVLMPNAAGTGLVSARTNASPAPAFAPFASEQQGQWIWVGIRRHSAQLVENVLNLTSGAEQSATFPDESYSLWWAPLLDPSATGTQIFANSTVIAGGNYSAQVGALNVGPDSSATGTCDIAKVFVVQQTLTQAQLREVAMGKRLQDIGVTVNDSTDFYYDLTSTTAANLLDLCGGTAATSATMAGSDGVTPVVNAPSVLQYVGSTGSGYLAGKFADGRGSKSGPQA